MTLNQTKNELKSGRLWLTIICGVCLLLFAGCICQVMWNKKETLSGSEITSMMNVLLLIVSNVMTFYFSKSNNDSDTDKERIFTILNDKNIKPTQEDNSDQTINKSETE